MLIWKTTHLSFVRNLRRVRKISIKHSFTDTNVCVKLNGWSKSPVNLVLNILFVIILTKSMFQLNDSTYIIYNEIIPKKQTVKLAPIGNTHERYRKLTPLDHLKAIQKLKRLTK